MIKRDFDIIQGDDYTAEDSRALVFTSAGQNWADLTGGTFTLKARSVGSTETLFSASGTRTVVSSTQYITVPLTAAQTNDLPEGTNSAEYDLQVEIGGRRVTLAKGFFSVESAPS